MSKRYLSKIALIGVSTSLLIPTSAAYGDTSSSTVIKPTKEVKYEQSSEMNNEKLLIEIYDKDDNLIKTYSEEEAKQFNQHVMVPNFLLPEVSGEKSGVNYYDENNILTSSSNKNLLNSQKEAIKKLIAANLKVYNFPKTSFSDSIWVAGGRTFYQPQSVHVIAAKQVNGMAVRLYQDNTYTGQAVVNGSFTGGLNIPVGHFSNSGGSYSIKLQNRSNYDISLSGGQVYYK